MMVFPNSEQGKRIINAKTLLIMFDIIMKLVTSFVISFIISFVIIVMSKIDENEI